MEDQDKLIRAVLDNNVRLFKKMLSNDISDQSTLRAACWWACRLGYLEILINLIAFVDRHNLGHTLKAKIDLELSHALIQATNANQTKIMDFLVTHIEKTKKGIKNGGASKK